MTKLVNRIVVRGIVLAQWAWNFLGLPDLPGENWQNWQVVRQLTVIKEVAASKRKISCNVLAHKLGFCGRSQIPAALRLVRSFGFEIGEASNPALCFVRVARTESIETQSQFTTEKVMN